MESITWRPGIHELTFGGHNRRYTIAIPSEYSDQNTTPLILVLHWGGMVTQFYGRGILEGLAKPALGELGAIIVAPDCPHGDWANPRSEAVVLDLLDYLFTQYNIDAEKILITGYSLGGIGTWYLAARHQERFTAAIPMACPPGSKSSEVNWQIPLFVIHSRRDELFPFEETEKVVRQLQTRGHPIEFKLIDLVTHFDTAGFLRPLQATVPWIRKVWGVRT